MECPHFHVCITNRVISLVMHYCKPLVRNVGDMLAHIAMMLKMLAESANAAMFSMLQLYFLAGPSKAAYNA